MKKLLFSIIPLLVILLVPILLRQPGEPLASAEDTLVIVSPHTEAVRYEFDCAFRAYYKRQTGRDIFLDWRSLGGTNDIVRYVGAAYFSAFREYWTSTLGREWNDQVAQECMAPKIPGEKSAARAAFLQSDLGIGIDVFFGGGQYDLDKQARIGTLVSCGLRKRHPEYFEGDEPILQQCGGGDVWYDKNDCYYGACYSSFGICMNLDRLRDLGYAIPADGVPLRQWRDLGSPKLFGAIGLADPTMSGSINKCYEMLIQRQMQDTVAELERTPQGQTISEAERLDRAWEEALLLLKRIGGNARYLTFSASQVPIDCASGQIAAGMCIDFYGRSQAEWEEEHVGRRTMCYATPDAGSSVTCDPIGIFRGAPHRKSAELFLDFVMSKEGQRLWGQRVGTPGGPVKYSLNRLPVRRDLYLPENARYASAPDARPLELAGQFQYQGGWTGRYFDLIRTMLRVMMIDCHDELQAAWKAILEAGGPEACPEAMASLRKLPFPHREASRWAEKLYEPAERARIVREWADFFRREFREAAEHARTQIAGGKT